MARTDARSVSWGILMTIGAVRGDSVRGEFRSHGPVLLPRWCDESTGTYDESAYALAAINTMIASLISGCEPLREIQRVLVTFKLRAPSLMART